MKPQEAAIASNSVDLPEPFSPTRKVTGERSVNSPRCRTAGRENGYSSDEGTRSCFR